MKNLQENDFGVTDMGKPVNVSSVVDPSAAQTNPFDTDYRPESEAELASAIFQLINGTRLDTQTAYALIKNALKSGEEDMKNLQLENLIREQVRKILSEAPISARFLSPMQKNLYKEIGIELGPNDVVTDEMQAKLNAHLGRSASPFKKGKMDPHTTPVSGFEDVKVTKVEPGKSGSARAEKYQKDLISKLTKMEVPEEVESVKWDPVQEKIDDVLADLFPEVINFLSERLDEIIESYNSAVGPGKKFNPKSVKGMTSLVNKFQDFMSHAAAYEMGDRASKEAFLAAVPKISAFYSLMRSPQRVFYNDKGMFNRKIRPLNTPLAKWMHDAADKIKEVEAFRRADSTTKIALNEKLFAGYIESWLGQLGVSPEKAEEIVSALVDAANEGSPSAKTNMIAEKIIQTAFTSTWDQALDSIGFSDWFPENKSSLEQKLASAIASLRAAPKASATKRASEEEV